MFLNDNAAITTAKELTIVAMQNNMITSGTSASYTAKNVIDFFFETANALAGKDKNLTEA